MLLGLANLFFSWPSNPPKHGAAATACSSRRSASFGATAGAIVGAVVGDGVVWGRLRVVPGVLNAAAPEPADGSDDDVDDAIGSAAGPGGSAAADDAAADDGADEAAVDEDREPLPPGDDHGTAKCCPAQLAAWKSLRAKIKRDPPAHPAAARVSTSAGGV